MKKSVGTDDGILGADRSARRRRGPRDIAQPTPRNASVAPGVSESLTGSCSQVSSRRRDHQERRLISVLRAPYI